MQKGQGEQGGWWLGTQVGGQANLFGSCPSEEELPPAQGWRLKRKGEKDFQEDAGGFVSQARGCDWKGLDGFHWPNFSSVPQTGSLGIGKLRSTTEKPSMHQEDLSVEALKRLDLAKLRGRLLAPSTLCAKYFGHFCALLHLEYFVEVLGLI